MFETTKRPLIELRFEESNDEQLEDVETWVSENSMFSHNEEREYILLMPHPKHPSLGGLSFDEFTKDCPDLLKEILQELYDSRVKELKEEAWTSEFDLKEDFGFVLVAFL